MKWLKAMAVSRKGRVILAILAGYFAWQGWLSYAAPGKIGDDLPRYGAFWSWLKLQLPGTIVCEFPGRPRRDKVNVVVTLSFPPERFHVQYMQKFGRVSGAQDNSIELRNVKLEDVIDVARPYWVTRVEPLKEEGG